jgi:hypothetical protein
MFQRNHPVHINLRRWIDDLPCMQHRLRMSISRHKPSGCPTAEIIIVFLILASALTIAEPVPPTAPIGVPDARTPLANSDRVVVTCPDGGIVGAEFQRERQTVKVVGIAGFSRALSDAQRNIVDSALRPLGSLDRVEIVCNGPQSAIVRVLGAFVEVERQMYQQTVVIVWENSGMLGTGRRAVPEMELELRAL